MNEKTKLIVFAKKEIFLLLTFFILSIFVSFTFGFRLGKDYSFDTGMATYEDRQLVDQTTAQMKAEEEESVEKQQMEQTEEADAQDLSDMTKDTNDMMVKRLQEELNKETRPNDAASGKDQGASNDDSANVEKVDKDQYGGKYTVQVGSFRSLQEAEEFAKGFQFRGYNPIIEKADLQEKGIRFRVSLGAFDNVAEARDYISNEKTLFLSQDYHIRPIE